MGTASKPDFHIRNEHTTLESQASCVCQIFMPGVKSTRCWTQVSSTPAEIRDGNLEKDPRNKRILRISNCMIFLRTTKLIIFWKKFIWASFYQKAFIIMRNIKRLRSFINVFIAISILPYLCIPWSHFKVCINSFFGLRLRRSSSVFMMHHKRLAMVVNKSRNVNAV